MSQDKTAVPSYTLSLVIECQTKVVRGWPVSHWELTTFLSDPEGPTSLEGPILIRQSDAVSQYLWKGLQLRLHIDAAEGYWYNFLSEVPYAFVIFEQDIDDDESIPIPLVVTASQDEAGAHLETDSLVLSAALPVDVRNQIEEYIVNNYVPQEKKKRKRKNWFQESNQPRPMPNE